MKSIKLFWKVITKKIYLLIFFVILSFLTSRIVAIGTNLISRSIDAVLVSENIDIKLLIFQILLLVMISMVLAFIKRVSIESYSIFVQNSYRKKIIYKLGLLQYDYINKNKGKIVTRLISDINDLGKFLSESIPDIIYYFIMLVTFSVYIMIMNYVDLHLQKMDL